MLPFEYTTLYSNLSLFFFVFTPALIFILLFSIVDYLIWILRAKNNIKKSIPLPKGNYKFAKIKGIFLFGLSSFTIFLLIFAIIMDSINGERFIFLAFVPWLIAVVVGIIYNKKMVEKDVSLKERIVVPFVIVFLSMAITVPMIIRLNNKFEIKELPKGYIGLTLEDFGMSQNPQYKSFTRSGSILVPRRSKYREWYYDNSIYTLNVEGRTPKITRYIFDEMIKEDLSSRYNRMLIKANNEYSDFDEAYYIDSTNSEDNERNILYLVKGNNIFYIDSDFDLSNQENVKIVINKVLSMP
jgi:hypothetical protein